MKNLIQAAAVTLCAVSTAHGQAAVQWKVADGGNGHWYQRVARQSRSWSTLRGLAAQEGGHLATLTSPAEKSFLVTNIVAGNFCFIGGFQSSTGAEPAGDWQWVTGEAFTWTNWAGGEPNNYPPSVDEDVMAIWGDGLWADVNEDAYLTPCGNAIFEWSADCNSDGIVDYGQILQGQLADTNTDGIPDVCQCATNPSLPGCCPGDLDHDATVGGADIGLLLSNWGPCGSSCLYDLNNDNKVNGGDLGLLLAGWGPCSN